MNTRFYIMGALALITGLTLTTPATANQTIISVTENVAVDRGHDVAAEQRQLAERVASRIKGLLENDPYTVEKTCDAAGDCTISIYR